MTQEIAPTPEAAALLNSPLHEATPDSLDELFSRDPLELSDQDLDSIVAHLRAQRNQWHAEEAAGAKKASKKGKAAPGPKEKISLENLELDL